MTSEKRPADWAIKRVSQLTDGFWDSVTTKGHPVSVAFARYIEAHEQPPVDRKLLCAREALARFHEGVGNKKLAKWYRDGNDDAAIIGYSEAITVWEEGFGNDQH